MAVVIKNCLSAIPWGLISCEATTGIAELYYCHYEQIKNIVFAATPSASCDQGEIASFALDTSVVVLPEELLQPINFVKQEDDTGALVEWTTTDEGGNKVRNYTATIQVVANTPDEQCSIDMAVGKEICLVFKGKDGYWRILNWSGGAKLQSAAGSTNLSYVTIILSGRVNSRQLFISYADSNTWANTALVPYSVDPVNGLLNV